MSTPQRQIFRQRAMEKYQQRQERDVLPPWVRPQVMLFLWVLIGLLIATCMLLWSVRLPTMLVVPGVVIQEQANPAETAGDVVAALFFAPTQRGIPHAHMPVTIKLGNTGVTFHYPITHIEPAVLGPDAIRARFHLQGVQGQLLTGPQIVVLVRLGPAQLAPLLVGSICQAEMQIGSRRILSFLPGIGPIFPN